MYRAVVGFFLMSCFLFTACGQTVKEGNGKTFSATDPDKNKPTPDDFTGTVGSFAGTWQGACSYVNNGYKNTNCTATLTLKQDTMSTFVMGTFQYTLGYTTSAAFVIHRLEIDGNALSLNGAQVGKIGKFALEFRDDTFGDFSAVISGKQTLGVNIMQLPSFVDQAQAAGHLAAQGAADGLSMPPAVDCSAQGYCFTGSLSRTAR
jgi:hypothetical protein